jgi:hypothetical protein
MKLSEISLGEDRTLRTRCYSFGQRVRDVSPLLAYYVLKDAFGQPNGQTLYIGSQWVYDLRTPSALLSVYDRAFGPWTIAVELFDADEELARRQQGGNPVRIAELTRELWSPESIALAERIASEFLELIRKQAPRLLGREREAAKRAQEHLIQNPFPLYYTSAEKLLAKANEDAPNAEHYCRSAFFLFMAAFEGLMNLVYEIYIKPDLRDKRITEHLVREDIDIKVRLAPLYCGCFAGTTIDHSSETFRRFDTLVNKRNDFVHANFTRPMRKRIAVEDGFTFVVDPSKEEGSALPENVDSLGPAHIEVVKEIIDGMVTQVTEAMSVRYRREFTSILRKGHVRLLHEDGEMIVVPFELPEIEDYTVSWSRTILPDNYGKTSALAPD